MHGLLFDKTPHVFFQFLISHERQGFVVQATEPELTRWQYQVDFVDKVTGEGLIGQPVNRRFRPIKFHVSLLQHSVGAGCRAGRLFAGSGGRGHDRSPAFCRE